MEPQGETNHWKLTPCLVLTPGRGFVLKSLDALLELPIVILEVLDALLSSFFFLTNCSISLGFGSWNGSNTINTVFPQINAPQLAFCRVLIWRNMVRLFLLFPFQWVSKHCVMRLYKTILHTICTCLTIALNGIDEVWPVSNGSGPSPLIGYADLHCASMLQAIWSSQSVNQ